jgi:transposase
MRGVDPHRLVFLDEASVETGMTRHFARCARGDRAVERVKTRGKKRVTLLGAMSLQGFEALSMLEGSVTGQRFSQWMVDVLLPKLGRGDVVVLDNASIHKSKKWRDRYEKAGVEVMFLPPYSPEFNPIEPGWHVAKSWIRKHTPRNLERLLGCRDELFELISSKMAYKLFAHSGYVCS